jgi:hypothetical protein
MACGALPHTPQENFLKEVFLTFKNLESPKPQASAGIRKLFLS